MIDINSKKCQVKGMSLNISDFLFDKWDKLYLEKRIKKAAADLASGGIILMASDTVYTLSVDGNSWPTVSKLRRIKGRAAYQREGIIGPPEQLFNFIDFELLQKLNPEITKEVIKKIYQANHVGLIVPCRVDAVPEHLVTIHEINGQKIPTVMNIWNSRYPIYQLFQKEIEKYPGVIWVGSSANRSNHPPLNFKEARIFFREHLSSVIRDRKLEKNRFQGSYTLISLIHNPPQVLRKGSIHPEKHPQEFAKFHKALPNLDVPSDLP